MPDCNQIAEVDLEAFASSQSTRGTEATHATTHGAPPEATQIAATRPQPGGSEPYDCAGLATAWLQGGDFLSGGMKQDGGRRASGNMASQNDVIDDRGFGAAHTNEIGGTDVRGCSDATMCVPETDRDGVATGGIEEGVREGGGTTDVAADWAEQARKHARVETWFHELVRLHFKGNTKPPFNEGARARAGFTPEWYLPLATSTSRNNGGFIA
jgi:hypothetical protein